MNRAFSKYCLFVIAIAGLFVVLVKASGANTTAGGVDASSVCMSESEPPAAAVTSFVPPANSQKLLTKIPFSQGQIVAESFHNKFSDCDAHNTCEGGHLKEYKCTTDPSRNTVILKLPPSTIFYDAKMGIDADGSKLSAEHPGETDQPATSLRYPLPGKPSLDADKIPYIVIPGGGFGCAVGVQLGDIAAVVYGGHLAYAVVGDMGPKCKLGEGSIELHERLVGPGAGCSKRDTAGNCVRSNIVGINKDVLYFIFAGSGAKIIDGLTPDNINERIMRIGQQLFDQLQSDQSH